MADWKPRIERIFHEIRIGNAAAKSLGEGLPAEGMIANFPSSIATMHGTEPMFWTTKFSVEPGSVIKPRTTRVNYSATVHNTPIEGYFYVSPTTATRTPPPAKAWLAGDDDKQPLTTQWATDLPGNVQAEVADAETLSRSLKRLSCRGERAFEHELDEVILPFIVSRVRAMRTQISKRATVWDENDAIQAARTLLIREAIRFASPERPYGSWGVVASFALKKLRRAMWATDWEPAEIIELRAAIQTNDLITPDMTLDEISDMLNGTSGASGRPRWSKSQIEHALKPAMTAASIEAPVSEEATIGDLLVSEPDDDGSNEMLQSFFQDAPFDLNDILPFLAEAGFVDSRPVTAHLLHEAKYVDPYELAERRLANDGNHFPSTAEVHEVARAVMSKPTAAERKQAADAGCKVPSPQDLSRVTRRAVDTAKEKFFAPFMRPGEFWAIPEDRERVTARAFAEMEGLSPDEMFQVWQQNTWRQRVRGINPLGAAPEIAEGQRWLDDDGLRRAFRFARKSAGLTRSDVAHQISTQLGIPVAIETISAWETRCVPDPAIRERIVNWYSREFDRFVDPHIEKLVDPSPAEPPATVGS